MTPTPLPRIACLADDSPKAQAAYHELCTRYQFMELGKRARPDVIVALGGDGFMLQVLHRFMHRGIPVYGMNCGSVGFLLNNYHAEDLPERIEAARQATLHPLGMFTRTRDGREHQELAINEVSLFRASRQAVKLRVFIDHVVRVEEMIGDGIIAATTAGSTAYNFSAGGQILPLSAGLIALTPIAPFRPRRWGGALLGAESSITFEVLEAEKRPVSAVADFTEIRDVVSVSVHQNRNITLALLFDPEHNLEERITKEQFSF